MSDIIKRINVGEVGSKASVDFPDLTEMQRGSFEAFLDEGITGVLERNFPVTDYTEDSYSLRIFDHRIEEPEITWLEAVSRGSSYEMRVYAQAELMDIKTGEIVTQEVFLGSIPEITERGTFVVNGSERCIVSQLSRAPGIYFESEANPSLNRNLYTAAVRPERGAWIEVRTYRKNRLYARVNQRNRFAATILLRAFGLSNSEMRQAFANVDVEAESYLENTLEKDPTMTQEEAILELYVKANPGDPRILDNAREYFENTFENPRYFSLGKVGRYKVNKRLGLDFPNEEEYHLLQQKDMVEMFRELIRLNVEQLPGDNIDHLSNRRIRPVGELVSYSFERGVRMLCRNIQERLSMASGDKPVTPSRLVNARPIVARVQEFFNSSRLSQYMEQSNPLSEVEHVRKISALGPGGLTRERAGPAVRDVQPSHFGRLGIIKTPEGQNIGLNLSQALFALRDEYGFLLTPYIKVEQRDAGAYITDEVEYLAADDEENYRIAERTIETDDDGKILEDTVTVRYQGDFVFASDNQVDYVNMFPSQMLGVSASLLPFVSSDVGPRALMGANMQTQAVPLVRPRASYTGTGVEKKAVQDSGWAVYAQSRGVVDYVDSQRIVIANDDEKEEYSLIKFMKTNDNTCFNQSPRVNLGQKVKKGECLVDGPSHEAGELALGRDLLAAFMPWDGFNYEDSIAVSESVVKNDLLSSIHIKSYEALVMETKLGPEEVTADIPNVSTESLRNLDESGVVVVGAQVKPGDVLVGKVAPKGELELTAEERLLRAIFGEKAREVRNTSLTMPHGEKGRVISVTTLTEDDTDDLPRGAIKVIKVEVAQFRKLKVGDKVTGRHGSKGSIAKIVPDEDMPYMEDGTVIDILLNPISILGRMNVGQIMETHLGWAGHALGEYYAVTPFDKLLPDLMEEKFAEAGLPASGKVTLYDGRSGEPFENEIAVGYAHILKLHHLVEDKIHARSTGPYSLITQQPLGGKAQMGGQRLGEMEVWALEAFGAAHTLQEMLTIKSDDVVGRAKAFEAIIKNEPIPEARVPESFKLLLKELNALALEVQPLKLVSEEEEEEIEGELEEETGEEMGEEEELEEDSGEESEKDSEEEEIAGETEDDE